MPRFFALALVGILFAAFAVRPIVGHYDDVIVAHREPPSPSLPSPTFSPVVRAAPLPLPPDETPPPLLPLAEVNTNARAATVNVFCARSNAPSDIIASGSGVVISPDGVILTNAHVAQYFLLDTLAGCVVRTGAPARNAYRAELAYLPPRWVEENKHLITKETVEATGERDFAFLKIIEPPAPLPYLGPETALEIRGTTTPVLVAAYSAGFLGEAALLRDLYLSSAQTTIQKIYGFGEQPEFIDVIGLGGSIAAQRGSSGGAVVSMTTGGLVGLVVTSSTAAQTSDRELNALTIDYIDRTLRRETNITLDLFGGGEASKIAGAFQAQEFDRLKQLLIAEID